MPMLRTNRPIRLVEETERRKHARRRKLEQIMDEIRDAEPPFVDAHILHPASRSAPNANPPPVQVSRRRLFPVSADLLEYPIIKDLDEKDVADSEMGPRFEAHREVIKAHVLKWRIKIEGYLAELIRKGRVSDGLKRTAPAPLLPIEKSKPNPLNGLSTDLKLLFRADSLFESGSASSDPPVPYDALFNTHPLLLMHGLRRGCALELPDYKRHGKAQEVARALLAGMGRPNASFLELQSFGQRFKCGSCQSRVIYPWEEMVRTCLTIWLV